MRRMRMMIVALLGLLVGVAGCGSDGGGGGPEDTGGTTPDVRADVSHPPADVGPGVDVARRLLPLS